jgi:16S rRNA (guanine966-N2)-methyltransferase
MPKSAPLKYQVRIIAGRYRRRLLRVVVAPESCHLRPTPERVRQTVFNWLDHFIADWRTIRVVDAFAGTGALGFEAASRGAASVLLGESFVPAARSLQATISLLQATDCTVRQIDALVLLASLPLKSVDLLLLDPPFNGGWLVKVQPLLTRILAPKALVYVESEAALLWEGFEVLRHVKAGAVHAQLLRAM